jgi:hypothetical protein
MEVRTTSKLVTFRHPFQFVGIDRIQPPGTYTVDVEEKKLDTLAVVGWQRTAVMLKLIRGGMAERIAIDMQDLREAQLRDGDQSTEPPARPQRRKIRACGKYFICGLRPRDQSNRYPAFSI